MTKGSSIKVRIGGRVFGLVSDEKPEYLTEVARRVDKSISGLLFSNPAMTFERAAVMSAIKFCDELNKEPVLPEKKDNNDENDILRQRVMEYSGELSKLESEYKKLEKASEKMRAGYEKAIEELCRIAGKTKEETNDILKAASGKEAR